MKEEINVISRDDGSIRLTYWNKAAGSTQVIFSKTVGKKIERQLRSILYDR